MNQVTVRRVPVTLSVIVPARNAASHLEGCLKGILSQVPAAHEVVVVDDASGDGTAQLAERLGCRVVRSESNIGVAAARNAGAAVASGDVLVFVDSDDEPRPGWTAALTDAFERGAQIVAGGLVGATPRSVVEAFSQARGGGHDLAASNGFLPWANTANLAARASVFRALGGFDPDLWRAADMDFSFRAGLAGFVLTAAPEAVVARHHRHTFSRLMRQVAADSANAPRLVWKYQRFPYLFARHRGDPRRVWRDLSKAGAWSVVFGWRQGRLAVATPWLEAMVIATRSAGLAVGSLAMITGSRRPPSVVVPSTVAETASATALADRPTMLVTGTSDADVHLLASSLRSHPRLAVAPARLAASAVSRWDDPAPWSLAMVREARASGWRLPELLAARRLEEQRPASWGAAFLALHSINAWLEGTRDHAIAVAGGPGAALAARLVGTPVIVVGGMPDLGRPPAVVLDRSDLRSAPEQSLARIESATGFPMAPEVLRTLTARLSLGRLGIGVDRQ